MYRPIARDSKKIRVKLKSCRIGKQLTVDEIAIVIEDWNLAERLLLQIFWGNIVFPQINRNEFVSDVFLPQDSCSTLRATRFRALVYNKCDEYVDPT
jgi:hypothetical protein